MNKTQFKKNTIKFNKKQCVHCKLTIGMTVSVIPNPEKISNTVLWGRADRGADFTSAVSVCFLVYFVVSLCTMCLCLRQKYIMKKYYLAPKSF